MSPRSSMALSKSTSTSPVSSSMFHRGVSHTSSSEIAGRTISRCGEITTKEVPPRGCCTPFQRSTSSSTVSPSFSGPRSSYRSDTSECSDLDVSLGIPHRAFLTPRNHVPCPVSETQLPTRRRSALVVEFPMKIDDSIPSFYSNPLEWLLSGKGLSTCCQAEIPESPSCGAGTGEWEEQLPAKEGNVLLITDPGEEYLEKDNSFTPI